MELIGLSKYLGEQIIFNYGLKHSDFNYCIFRFFNVIGAHPFGNLGELTGKNLVPCMIKALENNKPFVINGDDYKTKDSTCERDYIDVNDIVEAFSIIVNKMEVYEPVKTVLNLGTGKSTTVKELTEIFKDIVENDGQRFEYTFGDRREGDVESCYCNSNKAKIEIGFETRISLEESLKSAYNYYKVSKERASDDK